MADYVYGQTSGGVSTVLPGETDDSVAGSDGCCCCGEILAAGLLVVTITGVESTGCVLNPGVGMEMSDPSGANGTFPTSDIGVYQDTTNTSLTSYLDDGCTEAGPNPPLTGLTIEVECTGGNSVHVNVGLFGAESGLSGDGIIGEPFGLTNTIANIFTEGGVCTVDVV
jgi:hypothetical protein